jgi:hypothetical protein
MERRTSTVITRGPDRKRSLGATLTQPDVLTRHEVAAMLKITPRQVERLGIPLLDLGRRTKRYLLAEVLAWIEQQRTGRSA